MAVSDHGGGCPVLWTWRQNKKFTKLSILIGGHAMRALKRILAGFGALLAALSAVQAAPERAASSGGLEEVIVTAQKRSESVQDVPLSITTIGPVALQQQAITNFFDYGTKVPNLAFAMTGDGVGTARTISIRGISGDNVTGFYIDETPLPDSIDPRILDINHIEVLRGPQGTLYGARSMGGTVRVITQAPNFNEFEGTVHGEVSDTQGTNRPNYTGDAVFNIPLLAGRAALRLSGFYDAEAGFLKRRYCTDPATAGVSCFPQSNDAALTTTVKNVAATNDYGVAASLAFKVNDNLTVTPRIMQQRESYNGFPMSDVLTVPGPIGYPYPAGSAAFTLPRLTPSDFTQGRFFNIPEGGYDSWDLYSLNIKWNTGLGEFVAASAYFDRKVLETEDQTDFIWSALLPLAAIPIPGFPAAPLPLPISSSISEEKNYQRFVQEVRFASALPGPTQFVVGAFYSDLHGRLPFASYYPPALARGYGAVLNGAYGGAGTCAVIGFCPNPNNPDEIFGSDYHSSIREPAVFGEVSFEFTPALKATAGLRWSQVKTTAGGYAEGTVTQSPGAPGRIVDANTTTKDTATTPKLQLDYKIDPNAMVYTMIAKGFRPGGLVPSVPAALCAPELPTGITVDETRAFKSDSLWNYELGTKTEWMDKRLTLNASVFYIKWKDIQQNILLACGFQYRANAGAAESKGGEIEVNARPIPQLQLSFGIGYQNAKITETSAISPQQPGDPVFEVPDWTGNTSLSWTQPLQANWKLLSTIDYSYVGRSFSANNLANVNGVFETRLRPNYELLDARIALNHANWEFALVGKNLTNERANLGDNRSLAAETPGRPRLLVNQPQTIGLEFRTSF
jgi:iron complex outermembrane receptor protein